VVHGQRHGQVQRHQQLHHAERGHPHDRLHPARPRGVRATSAP
jgi:hypothetical protein